ncbi:translesion DNA synthesis-associated protein ImuA [Alcaligenes endophyticus]|uniref:Translesion DNA synthesis-associated protein ImuA n=1 Tax=Alcaligenes endophyticus TaxID=1929088 RepID=A0ABT8EJZ6_9BURK|nr:translesion DNA synthesis-associated protein ImuA [Alcaligenes endophyticus]MCX5591893.1 translesion DNA synthesis-associated protein ImuA [Alcaligenes endophyticus]MDN4121582.1 translesion DNA synthesis-associated protein ImuA [Alcaligenes endophyticus]
MKQNVLHPAVWRAHQLPSVVGTTLSSGFSQLDAELPGRGWPVGTLIELIPQHTCGTAELSLLQPCLQALTPATLIVLLTPPHPPCLQAWYHHGLAQHRLLWLNSDTAADAYWAALQVLRHHQHAFLCYWPAHPLSYAQLRQLHVLARQTQNVLFLMPPASAGQRPSPAPLRVRYRPQVPAHHPNSWGLAVHLLKGAGLLTQHELYLPLWQAPPASHTANQPRVITPTHEPLPVPFAAAPLQKH